jgi:hypothetical protein
MFAAGIAKEEPIKRTWKIQVQSYHHQFFVLAAKDAKPVISEEVEMHLIGLRVNWMGKMTMWLNLRDVSKTIS